MPEMKYRTRFAPSPTGFMHLGNLRTALYAWLLARGNGGDFILRIEDTDRDREVKGATDAIYDILKRCGLGWDEGPDIGGKHGPYVQSQRLKIYRDHAEKLLASGSAYRCFCTENRLSLLHESQRANGQQPCYDRHCRDLSQEESDKLAQRKIPYVIRQKVPLSGDTTFVDEVFGEIKVPNSDLDDQVLLKSDGYPTYNFANVVDDHLMEITHVVRGNEYLSSTPKYNLLYQAFGWTPPEYIHVNSIMRDASHKLSKRQGDAYFTDFTAKGYLTEAIVNYIALLGWAPKGENEIFSLDELTEEFDVSGLSKSPSIFDAAKLRAINGMYVRALPPEEFQAHAEPYIVDALRIGQAECINTATLCNALQPRTETFCDIAEQIDFIDEAVPFTKEEFVNAKMKVTPESALDALQKTLPLLTSIAAVDYSPEKLNVALNNLIGDLGVKNGYILWPLRFALSGKQSTPGGGAELCAILGRAVSLRRINNAIAVLSA